MSNGIGVTCQQNCGQGSGRVRVFALSTKTARAASPRACTMGWIEWRCNKGCVAESRSWSNWRIRRNGRSYSGHATVQSVYNWLEVRCSRSVGKRHMGAVGRLPLMATARHVFERTGAYRRQSSQLRLSRPKSIQEQTIRVPPVTQSEDRINRPQAVQPARCVLSSAL